MSYTNTFIRISADCPVAHSVVPEPRGGQKTVPQLQYELLASEPYRYTGDDVIWEVHVRHKQIPDDELAAHAGEIRQQLFCKPHPCLRASMLPKKYGWGVHYDEQGRIALYGAQAPEYQRFVQPDSGVTVLNAMRNKKAS